MNKNKPTLTEQHEETRMLIERLAEAQETIQALTSGQPAAVMDAISTIPTLLEEAQAALHRTQNFSQSTLDALSTHIVVLDVSGKILTVNAAWRAFAEANDLGIVNDGIGTNYLEVCAKATGEGTQEARAATQGIREVIANQQATFSLQYPCHSPDERRWFNMYVSRFRENGVSRIVVAHENVTERKEAEEVLANNAYSFEMLRTIEQAILSNQSIEEAADAALHLIVCYRASVELLAPDTDELVVKALRISGEPQLDVGTRTPLKQLGNTDAFRRGEVRVIEDLLTSSQPPAILEVLQNQGIGSMISAPIMLHGDFIGLLNIASDGPMAFSDQHIGYAREITDSMANAIQHICLREQAQSKTSELEVRNQQRQREITERKRAEDALRQSENRYRILTELTSNYTYLATITTDHRTITEWATEPFSQITGYTVDEINTRGGWRSVIHREDLPRMEQFRRTLFSNESIAVEYRILTKQGKVCWLRDYAKPEWDTEEERVVRVLGAV